jgi:hypothetical protein
MSPFGWGQRTCIGQGITEDENLLACGGIAWGFNIDFKYTASGEKIDVPTNKSNSLLIIKPDKFEINIVPRSEERFQDIVGEYQAAEEADQASKANCGKVEVPAVET